MKQFTYNNPPDITRYQELLTEVPYIWIDANKLNDAVVFMSAQLENYANLTLTFMRCTSRDYVSTISDEAVYLYLTNQCGVHTSCLRTNKASRGWSIALSKLERLSSNPRTADFIELYSSYSKLKSRRGLLKGMYDRSESTSDLGHNDVELRKVSFSVSPSQNLRFVTKSHNVIQIPKTMASCITVPKGYYLAWGDFASADMIAALNLFLLESKEDIEIAKKYPKDGYAIFAHLISRYYGEEFDYEHFKENRSLYKLYALKTIYGNKYAYTKEEQDFIKRAQPYLLSRTKYKEYLNQIGKVYDLQIPLEITSYFGFSNYLDRDAKNSELQQVIDKALNTPVQTHTSERVICQVLSIVDQFIRLGYNCPDDFHVYFVRHDEPLFIFSEKMIKDMWVLKDNSVLCVDDGIHQYVDWYYGYNYTEPNDELHSLAVKSYEDNADKLTIITEQPRREPRYFPVKNSYEMGVSFNTVGNDLVATIYMQEFNSVSYKLFKGEANAPNSRKILLLQDLFTRQIKFAQLPNVKSIVVYNNVLTDSLFQDGVFIYLSSKPSTTYLTAEALCNLTCTSIANRNGLPTESYRKYDDSYINILSKVGDSNVF